VKKTLFILSILSVLLSCSSTKTADSERMDLEIRFGNSGGFTNIPMEYVLYGDGELAKVQNGQETVVHSVGRKTMREIKKIIASMDFEHLEINDPGNRTYFIKIKNDAFENAVRWNDSTDNDPIKTLYKKLTGILTHEAYNAQNL
jgi:hypothetical protein